MSGRGAAICGQRRSGKEEIVVHLVEKNVRRVPFFEMKLERGNFGGKGGT